MKMIFALVLLVAAFAFPQNKSSEAQPAIGWDSLKTLFVYPEIARRAGVEEVAGVSVSIDSTGRVTDVEFAGAGIFSESVKSVVRSAQWIPESFNGKRRNSEIVFEVQFQLKEKKSFPKRRVLTVESTNSAVR